MACLTKTKKPNKRPRCQVIAAYSGLRCKFNGIQYVDGKCVCRRHSGAGK